MGDAYEMRAATPQDLDAVVELVDTADEAMGVAPDATREFLSWLWRIAATDLTRDTRLVHRGGEIAAFAQGTWREEEGGPLSLFVRVHPDHRDAGLDRRLVAWAESLAEQRGTEGVRASVPHVDDTAKDALRDRGYREVRAFYMMGRTLAADEDPGTPPSDVTLRTFEDGDERRLFDVHEASFADHWGFRPSVFETFIAELYGDDWDPSFVYIAEADGRAVGHLIGFRFEAQAFVGMLGVVPACRGRGIATAMLHRAFADASAKGFREVTLGVDAQNPHGAVALYEGVGMTVRRRDDTFDLGTES
jgi:mycothiol synthase